MAVNEENTEATPEPADTPAVEPAPVEEPATEQVVAAAPEAEAQPADAAPATVEASASVEPAPAPVAPEPAPAPDAPSDLAARIEQLEKASAERLEQLRAATLENMGVLPKYTRVCDVDADPTTDEGKLALEKWVSDNRELAPGRTVSQPEINLEGFKADGAFGVTPAKMAKVLAKTNAQDWNV